MGRNRRSSTRLHRCAVWAALALAGGGCTHPAAPRPGMLPATSAQTSAQTSAPEAASPPYVADPAASRIAFTVSHRGAPLQGSFGEVQGVFVPPSSPGDPGRLEVVVAARSVDTANPLRDAHLRTGGYFHAAAHPAIAFRSTRLLPPAGDADPWRADGVLSLRGVDRPLRVELHPRPKPGGADLAFSTRFTVQRSAFAMPDALRGHTSIGDAVQLDVLLVWHRSPAGGLP